MTRFSNNAYIHCTTKGGPHAATKPAVGLQTPRSPDAPSHQAHAFHPGPGPAVPQAGPPSAAAAPPSPTSKNAAYPEGAQTRLSHEQVRVLYLTLCQSTMIF